MVQWCKLFHVKILLFMKMKKTDYERQWLFMKKTRKTDYERQLQIRLYISLGKLPVSNIKKMLVDKGISVTRSRHIHANISEVSSTYMHVGVLLHNTAILGH